MAKPRKESNFDGFSEKDKKQIVSLRAKKAKLELELEIAKIEHEASYFFYETMTITLDGLKKYAA